MEIFVLSRKEIAAAQAELLRRLIDLAGEIPADSGLIHQATATFESLEKTREKLEVLEEKLKE